MNAYQAGSDAKTVKLASALIAKVSAAIDDGMFDEAEKLIAAGTTTPNRPFRIEFLAQVGSMQ